MALHLVGGSAVDCQGCGAIVRKRDSASIVMTVAVEGRVLGFTQTLCLACFAIFTAGMEPVTDTAVPIEADKP